jgi:hypothetical protein
MDALLLEALSDILADALLADLESEMEEEQEVTAATAESPTGISSRKDQDQLLAVSSLEPDSGSPSDPIVVPA